jgi:hypothetical protein
LKATIFRPNGCLCFSYLLDPFLTFFFLFFLGFQALPPGKLSPDRDGASDPDADKKGLDSEMDMVSNSDSPILLIAVVSRSIGYWVLIHTFLLFSIL